MIGLEAIPQSDRRRELWKSWEPRLSLTEEGRCSKFGSYTSVRRKKGDLTSLGAIPQSDGRMEICDKFGSYTSV